MTIDELHKELYSKNSYDNPTKFIEFYESRIKEIDVLFEKSNDETKFKLMRIQGDYVHFLVRKENYRKALPIISNTVSFFEYHLESTNKDLFENQYFENIIFDRVVANYYSKQLKKAANDLNKLRKRFPHNDSYKSWSIAIKAYSYDKIIKVCWYLSFGVIFATTFIPENNKTYKPLLYLGATALLTAMVGEGIKLIRVKKYKNVC